MRQAILLAAAGAAILAALPWSSAQADGVRPGRYAHWQLKFGSASQLYDAGCLKWNFQNQAWYTHCGLPQNNASWVAPIAVKY